MMCLIRWDGENVGERRIGLEVGDRSLLARKDLKSMLKGVSDLGLGAKNV
jgi:hypothetical protein